MLHDHFIAPLEENEYEDKHKAFHNHVDNFMDKYKTNHNQNNSITNRPYTRQEVMFVINHLNLDSAMAFDFIHYRMIAQSSE